MSRLADLDRQFRTLLQEATGTYDENVRRRREAHKRWNSEQRWEARCNFSAMSADTEGTLAVYHLCAISTGGDGDEGF